MAKLDKHPMKESLFKFLESIYFFEKQEEIEFGLNWDEIYLLQILVRNPGLCVTEIAGCMKSKPFAISRMLRKMEEAGFVQKINDKKDKRFFHQHVTESGLRKISEIEEYNYSVVVSHLEKMTEEHSEFLLSVLDNLGEMLKIPTE